jgi:hypothetical protein
VTATSIGTYNPDVRGSGDTGNDYDRTDNHSERYADDPGGGSGFGAGCGDGF